MACDARNTSKKIVPTTHLVAKLCVARRSVWPVRRRHFCPHQVLGEAAHLVLVFRGKHRVLGLLHLHTAQVAYREKWSRSRSVSSCMLRSGVVGRGALHVRAKHGSCDMHACLPDWEHSETRYSHYISSIHGCGECCHNVACSKCWCVSA
jgi:hypothetical protein